MLVAADVAHRSLRVLLRWLGPATVGNRIGGVGPSLSSGVPRSPRAGAERGRPAPVAAPGEAPGPDRRL